MGRVRLKDLDVRGLVDRYHAVVNGRRVSEVLSGKKSRSHGARLSAVERAFAGIQATQWMREAADAGMCLALLDDGTFKPT